MAIVQHNALTGASLHEPKGADTATVDKLYAANGAGSGTWRKLTSASIDTTSVFNHNKRVLTFTIESLNPAASYYIPMPYTGTISNIYSVIDAAITGANDIITFEIANVAVTGGTITITQAGSAAGDVDSCTPSAANAVTAGTALEVVNDGGASNAIRCVLTIEITMTA